PGSVASEIWSLGATLYTLLASRSPFEPATGERIPRDQLQSRIIRGKLVPTGRDDVSERVEAALALAMAPEPGNRYDSMYAFAEELRWAQYDLGLPPTALEVAAPEWAGAAAAVDFSTSAPRGPVISTVRQDSRRAARAETLASAQRRRDELAAATPKKRLSPLAAAAIGAGAGIIVVGGGVVAILAAAGCCSGGSHRAAPATVGARRQGRGGRDGRRHRHHARDRGSGLRRPGDSAARDLGVGDASRRPVRPRQHRPRRTRYRARRGRPERRRAGRRLGCGVHAGLRAGLGDRSGLAGR